jgi:hypothetical protein
VFAFVFCKPKKSLGYWWCHNRGSSASVGGRRITGSDSARNIPAHISVAKGKEKFTRQQLFFDTCGQGFPITIFDTLYPNEGLLQQAHHRSPVHERMH